MEPLVLTQWVQEERKQALAAFPNENLALLHFLADRIALLRFRQEQRMNMHWANLLYRLCPGLLDSSPAFGWVEFDTQGVEPCEIKPLAELRVELDGGKTTFFSVSNGIGYNEIFPWKATPLRKDSEGWISFEIIAERKVSMEQIWLDLRDAAGAHWATFACLRKASKVMLEWDSCEGGSRWCGEVGELWGSSDLSPANAWDALRSLLLNMDCECRLLLRLPSECRHWTRLLLRFALCEQTPLLLTCTPRLALVPVIDRRVHAIPWVAQGGQGPLITEPGEVIIRVLRVLERKGTALSLVSEGPWSPLYTKADSFSELNLELDALPHLEGTYVLEIESCRENVPSWNSVRCVQWQNASLSAMGVPMGALTPFHAGIFTDVCYPLIIDLVSALLDRRACWEAWKGLLCALSGGEIPAWHPYWAVKKLEWNAEGTCMILQVQGLRGGMLSMLENTGRMLCFSQSLERFLASIAPWLGRIKIEARYES